MSILAGMTVSVSRSLNSQLGSLINSFDSQDLRILITDVGAR